VLTALQRLERGRAERGEVFHPLQLRHADGRKIRCSQCGSEWWVRRPLLDQGAERMYACAKECGFGLLGR
jgi:hypothetical protein